MHIPLERFEDTYRSSDLIDQRAQTDVAKFQTRKDIMSKLYIVATSAGGFAREDASTPRVVGAYTDPDVAECVRKVAFGSDASVTPVEIDHIPPGLLQAMDALGIKLPGKACV